MQKYKFEKNTVSIVAYHYIRESNNSNYQNFNFLKVKDFEKQLKFFKKKFHVVSAEELIYFFESKEKLSHPLLMLSFDDGYIDHYKYVLPLLSENKIKGCFYPPTNIFKNRLLNVNKIHFILNFFQNRDELFKKIKNYLSIKFKYEIDKNKLKKIFSTNKLNKKIPEYDDKATIIIKKLLQKILPENIRDKTCDYLLFEYLKYNESFLCKETYMNIKQLKELSSEGMHIGSHGSDHQNWSQYDLNYQKKQINLSKSFFIKNKIKLKNFSVCYPWGSYNNHTKQLMKTMKLSFGLTSDTGNFKLHSKLNRFFLPRLDANEFKNI